MDTKFMEKAINIAKKSKNDVPIGAVIVCGDKAISFAHNTNVKTKFSTNHAEIIAINKACKKLGTNKLVDCDIYVTKEPCLMCMGAIINSRIKNLYFGCYDTRFNVVEHLNAFSFNHNVNIVGGIMEEECAFILSKFFKNLRGNYENSRNG